MTNTPSDHTGLDDQCSELRISSGFPFPNPGFPVLLWRRAVSGEDLPGQIESLFRANGWEGIWHNGVFSYHHFHATAHEVLGCARGWVRVQLGGPNGQEVRLVAGDIVVLPAGTSHKNLGHSPDYLIIGAYPPGQRPDMEYGDPDRYDSVAGAIRNVPVPESNPVTGTPMSRWWIGRD